MRKKKLTLKNYITKKGIKLHKEKMGINIK
jgi:hypothetical protein